MSAQQHAFIDPWYTGWWDALVSQSRLLPSGHHLHLLIDSAFEPHLHQQLQRATDQTVQWLFNGFAGDQNELASVSPLVWRFDPHNSAVRSRLDRLSGSPTLSALQTPEDAATLAARMARWCIVEVDGQHLNLRFPDTRRLPGIYRALTPEQRISLVGPATQWRYLDRNGQWTQVPLEAALFSEDPLIEPQLNADQFAAMMDDGEVDAMMLILGRKGILDQMKHSDAHAIIDTALVWARQAALQDDLHESWCEACIGDSSLINHPDPQTRILLWRDAQTQ